MPDHAVTQPSAGVSSSAITTIAPTDVGELPPDMLADATFEARYAVGDVTVKAAWASCAPRPTGGSDERSP